MGGADPEHGITAGSAPAAQAIVYRRPDFIRLRTRYARRRRRLVALVGTFVVVVGAAQAIALRRILADGGHPLSLAAWGACAAILLLAIIAIEWWWQQKHALACPACLRLFRPGGLRRVA